MTCSIISSAYGICVISWAYGRSVISWAYGRSVISPAYGCSVISSAYGGFPKITTTLHKSAPWLRPGLLIPLNVRLVLSQLLDLLSSWWSDIFIPEDLEQNNKYTDFYTLDTAQCTISQIPKKQTEFLSHTFPTADSKLQDINWSLCCLPELVNEVSQFHYFRIIRMLGHTNSIRPGGKILVNYLTSAFTVYLRW